MSLPSGSAAAAPPGRAVQLAPSSLALVLRREDKNEASAEAEPSGASVFQAFRRANAACYWNGRLARAVAQVRLQGWLRGGVLLLQGPAAPLQLLRDAWLRRTLRPPQGFLIRAVGDVSPVHMNPILQSQFVPLAEVLCCVISDMNAADITVTQETLLEHLGKYYPGIARPSHDIMYSTLGMLIKERKIYHTGEGYFIVTPNTYFISNSAMKSSSKGALLKYNDPLDPSGTCTVNMEAELIRDCFLIASHCRSCHCFPEQTALNEQRHQQAGSQEPNGQRLKGSCESRFSVQNPATDMLADNHSRETAAHSSYSVKEKEKGKKFGLSLFWRNTSKKEKPTKIYSSFAAQFPPEEWPVRDEDNLDNIPRDVEYEIIRRINPILTTDNLIKHAALMQKIEKQKQYISQGTSTEALTKHKHLSKVYARKKQSKTAKRHRKAQSNKEKQISKTQREIKVDELIPDFDELETYVEHLLPSEVIVCSKQPCEDGKDVDSHLIYKKKISNPFQDIPRRGNKYTKECKNQKTSELKSRAPKSKKNFPRPHSLDLSRTLDYNAEQFFIIKCGDEKEQLATDDSSHVQNDGSDYADYSHYQALQSGSKYEYLRESSACKHTMRTTQASVGERYSCNAVMDEKSVEMKYSQKSNQAHPCDKADIYGLLDDNSHQLKNICLSNYKGVTHQFNQSENTASFRHNGHLKSERNSNSTSKWLDLVNPQCKELMYNEQAFYQKVRSGNSCSSLYHAGEHHSDTESFDLHAKQFLCHSSDIGKGNDTGQEPGSQVWGNRSHFLENKTDKNKLDCCDPEGNECLSLTRSKDSLKEYPKVSLERESCSCHQVARYAYDERAGSKAHGQMLGTVDSSAFDFYDVHETDGKSWQKSVNEVGGKLASFALRQKGKEIKTNLAGDTQSSENLVAAVQDHNMQHERNHLEGTGNHSITGDSGIDSPRTQSLASANSAILDGLKKRSFLMNLEGLEKTVQRGRTLTQNPLLQLTPVMNV